MDSLTPGQNLLHYRLISKLGEGGMGVVWKATDGTLGREVAVKILPPDFARDPDRLARFEREARLLASLSHPNIAVVHGLHEDQGVRFLAMELVPGQDLAHRIGRGALPMDEALAVAADVAAALESAHSNGVIHRDLKPANVQLTPDGDVKVLDFGLAKALLGDPAASATSWDASASPTVTSAETVAGVILGTAAYMSPEQARGKSVDRRADVWAFGCLLYEMLTGERVFTGETLAEVLGAVLHTEPDLSRLPPRTPPGIRRLIARCLRKNPKQRLRDMGDAGIEIAEAIDGDAPETVAVEAVPPRSGRTWRAIVPWVVAGFAILVAFGIRQPAPPVPQVTRSTLELPAGSSLQSELALSRDGRSVVYSADDAQGELSLFRRSLDRFEPEPIAGTTGATRPFLSPDGIWVGFFADGRIWKIPVQGGAPIQIAAGALWFGAAWLPDDTIVFGGELGGGLLRVSASGGATEALTTPDTARGEVSHGLPSPLPGGKTLLFTIGTGQSSHVGLLSLETGQWRRLVEGGASARYLATGHLVYSRAGHLRLVPFDLHRLETTGSPIPILDEVAWINIGGLETARFATSPDGTLVYVSGSNHFAGGTFVVVDRDGATERLDLERGSYLHPRVSPDGRRIAYSGSDPEDRTGDIWLLDLERGGRSRLTREGTSYTPVWTPDGKRVAYVSNGNIFWTAVDGSGEPEPLLVQSSYNRPFSFSPDGKTLAFVTGGQGGDIGFLSIEDRSARHVATPFNENAPIFSPDGSLMAYVSDESGRDEIRVQDWPGPGRKWTVSTEGGRWPVWSADGTELFYRNADRIMVVAVRRQPDTSFGRPRVVFEGPYYSQTMVPNFDVWPDGRRFVMVEYDRPPQDRIRVVQNWLQEVSAASRPRE